MVPDQAFCTQGTQAPEIIIIWHETNSEEFKKNLTDQTKDIQFWALTVTLGEPAKAGQHKN